jgi:hypothetical protein
VIHGAAIFEGTQAFQQTSVAQFSSNIAVSFHQDEIATQFAADTSIRNALIFGSSAHTYEREERNE